MPNHVDTQDVDESFIDTLNKYALPRIKISVLWDGLRPDTLYVVYCRHIETINEAFQRQFNIARSLNADVLNMEII